MKLIKRAIAALLIFVSTTGIAQLLPTVDNISSSTGIAYTSANTWQNYTYTFSPSTTGANYVGFAFRQDPAYWTLGNVLLNTGGGSNLVTNGNFATGGAIPGQNGLQAPQYWGVWYQNGTTPAAAGTWQAPGQNWQNVVYNGGQGVNTSTAGSWIDGAVGSFDGIYQGVSLTSGITYSLSFSVYGNNTVNSGVQIGVYAGACADVTIAAANCSMRAGSGFTTLATPAVGSNAGNTNPPPPPAPTIVSSTTANSVSSSSVNGTPVVTNSTAYGAPTSTVALTDARRGQTPQVLTVTRTTTTTTVTPWVLTTVTTTPVTTTVTTTPVTTDTYSDGSVVVTNGTPVVTSSVANNVVTVTTNGSATGVVAVPQDYTTRIDQLAKLGQINGALNHGLDSDILGRHPDGTQGWNGRDGVDWVNVQGSRSNTPDSTSFNTSRIGVGYDHRISSDLTVGAQYHRVQANMSSDNSSGQLQKDALGVYALKSYKDWLFKADVAGAVNRYSTAHSLPELGYANSASTNGVDLWVNGRAYAPAYRGIRPFVGARYDLTKTNGAADAGSDMTAVTYDPIRQSQTSYESGVRVEQVIPLLPSTNVYAEVSRNTQDLNTVSAGLSTNVKDRTQVRLGFNSQRFNGFVNNSAQASVQIAF